MLLSLAKHFPNLAAQLLQAVLPESPHNARVQSAPRQMLKSQLAVRAAGWANFAECYYNNPLLLGVSTLLNRKILVVGVSLTRGILEV